MTLKLLKLPLTGFYGYIIQSMKYLSDKTKKYSWQKKHNENLSGTNKAYKPNKISKKQEFKPYETWKD